MPCLTPPAGALLPKMQHGGSDTGCTLQRFTIHRLLKDMLCLEEFLASAFINSVWRNILMAFIPYWKAIFFIYNFLMLYTVDPLAIVIDIGTKAWHCCHDSSFSRQHWKHLAVERWHNFCIFKYIVVLKCFTCWWQLTVLWTGGYSKKGGLTNTEHPSSALSSKILVRNWLSTLCWLT